MSEERKKYLKKIRKEKIIITTGRLFIIFSLLILWELLTKYKIINPFIYSSPSRIIKQLVDLYKENTLFIHIYQTIKEIIIAFLICQIISVIGAIILYEYKLFAKIIDPFIILINSMPKVALGPLIIIISGANIKSIIIMALLINIIVTTLTIYNGITQIDQNKINLMKSFKATKTQELKYLILPNGIPSIISSLKINISMTLIGVIMGEFLVSKQGIGYLIIYGSQIFNLNLVITGILLIIIISYLLYIIINILNKHIKKSDN